MTTYAADKPRDADEAVTRLVNWVEAAEEATQTARALAERDRDYYDGIQLTPEEEAELKKRGQPPITFNKIKRKVEYLTGLEKMKRTDPRAFPRNPQDEDSAEAVTDAIRYVCDNNDFDRIRSLVWENMLVEGAGGCEVTVARKRKRRSQMLDTTALGGEVADDYEIVINHYSWDRIGWDPASRAHDFSDARYKYAVIWMDLAEAKARYPKAADILASTINEYSLDETYDDRPRWTGWADKNRQRVKLVLMYYREPEDGWQWCLFTKGGKIDGGPSPFMDENGEPECPLIFSSAYVDRENRRYGVVRDMISPQDEINKRRSRLLHMLTMRQVIADDHAVHDERKVKEELAKPDGFIRVAPNGRFDILPNGDQGQGQFALLADAMQEMDNQGPNATMTGKDPAQRSGRAILASQQGGEVEVASLFDKLRVFNQQVYRQIWNRVRQYWTEERWVRVTDNERNLKFVGLNRPVTRGEAIIQQMKEGGAAPQEMQALIERARVDPRFQEPVAVENNVTELDMDIIVEDAPDNVTLQIEQFEQIVQLVQAGVPFPPDVLIQMAPNLRNKKEIMDRLSGGDDPNAQAQAQLQQAVQQAQLRKLVAEAVKAEFAAQVEEAKIADTKASAMQRIASAAEDRADAINKGGEAMLRARQMDLQPAEPSQGD